jgi:hypothetical protein
MPSPASWVDRPDLPRRVPASQAGAYLLGHGQHTTTMEPRIGIKPTSTAYNAALTSGRRGGGRGGARTRYCLHTKQVFGPLNFTTANWGR